MTWRPFSTRRRGPLDQGTVQNSKGYKESSNAASGRARTFTGGNFRTNWGTVTLGTCGGGWEKWQAFRGKEGVQLGGTNNGQMSWTSSSIGSTPNPPPPVAPLKAAVYSPFPSCRATMWRHGSAATIYTCAGGRDSSCSLLLNRGGATEERLPTMLFLRTRRRDIPILVPIDIVYAGSHVSLISYTSLDIQLRFSSPGCLSLYSIMSITLHCYYSTSMPHLVSHPHSSVWQQFSYEMFVSIYLNNLMIILYNCIL